MSALQRRRGAFCEVQEGGPVGRKRAKSDLRAQQSTRRADQLTQSFHWQTGNKKDKLE
ncbi:hypothetical protein BDV35DRAFT_154678 [Aspergillus flavus]|uniref:Uncharacterized protein n=1 Tax=Aspergillus flavus TaxID=5059 RepID=A0A5N6H2V3_ASPFL|nr:hypothetical protein BDV35DRAFT_154678 [Aspergillus flavus]